MSREPAGDNSEPQLSASRENESDEEENCRYKMDYPSKGICVIINMENFSDESKKRSGTDKDAKCLEKIFTKMKFEVLTQKDKKCDEILTFFEEVANKDHTERSCFVCIIMSHGDKKGIFAYDKSFSIESVYSLFEEDCCSSLAGKPKLFFIQACRGESLDSGVQPYSGVDDEPTSEICIDADFLFHYSTPQGYYSWRKAKGENKGSWFIQTLCKMLEEHRNDDLMHILTLVNNHVARNYTSSCPNTPEYDQKKQIPCIVSKLTRDLYLNQ